ncbi:AlpA family transcriptional regulator [Enterobacterales bacterium CwR94]|nr:AlpA family transcriptional regulator [Enterobacterales bacterium CwR94]
MPDIERITEKEVMELVEVNARNTIYRYIRDYGFPKPITTYPKKYLKAEVVAWILNGGINQRLS